VKIAAVLRQAIGWRPAQQMPQHVTVQPAWPLLSVLAGVVHQPAWLAKD